MRVGLDTSVVLRLLTGEPERSARLALQMLYEMRSGGGEVVVSDLVVSEAYFALQHHYAVPKETALRQLRALLESGQLQAAGHAVQVLMVPGLAKAKPGFVDRLIYAGYAEDVDQVLTFEKASRKLPKARVLGD